MVTRTLALIYVLASFPLGFAQQSASSDHQAVLLRDVLTRVVATAGGQDALASVQDLTESGEITFHWAKDVDGPVVIKSIGSNRFRMDADARGFAGLGDG